MMEPRNVLTEFWELKRKPRLLVVEDENDIGNLLKLCFTGLGMDVTVTVLGREGLALFSTQLFDLVMLDVNLPNIDGFEVMRVIKNSGNRNVSTTGSSGECITRGSMAGSPKEMEQTGCWNVEIITANKRKI